MAHEWAQKGRSTEALSYQLYTRADSGGEIAIIAVGADNREILPDQHIAACRCDSKATARLAHASTSTSK